VGNQYELKDHDVSRLVNSLRDELTRKYRMDDPALRDVLSRIVLGSLRECHNRLRFEPYPPGQARAHATTAFPGVCNNVSVAPC
jgi:hypothetical protein